MSLSAFPQQTTLSFEGLNSSVPFAEVGADGLVSFRHVICVSRTMGRCCAACDVVHDGMCS